MKIQNYPQPLYDIENLKCKALELRRSVLIQAAGKGQGYVGQAFGIADMLSVLFFYELQYDVENPDWVDRDRFFLSVGHYSIALWAVLAEAGYISKNLLPSYGSDGSILEMSTIEGRVPGVEMTGGSLGHGLGIAAGAALGIKLHKSQSKVFCMISDGELQEGSIWEAATFAATQKLDRLVLLVDCNGIQADGPLVVNIEPVAEKWSAFGWDVIEIDGNDIQQIISSLHWAKVQRGRPKAIVARTIPGKGVLRLEQRERAHFVNVASDEWQIIAKELENQNV